jgi:sulfur carrier protein
MMKSEAQVACQMEYAWPMPASTLTLTVNGAPTVVVLGGATITDLVVALGLAGKRIAVEKNGEIVPRSRYADTPVTASDRVEIVAAVGGG